MIGILVARAGILYMVEQFMFAVTNSRNTPPLTGTMLYARPAGKSGTLVKNFSWVLTLPLCPCTIFLRGRLILPSKTALILDLLAGILSTGIQSTSVKMGRSIGRQAPTGMVPSAPLAGKNIRAGACMGITRLTQNRSLAMTLLNTRSWPRRALALPGLWRSHYRILRQSNARYASLRQSWSLARTVLVPGPRLRREVGEGERYPRRYGFAWIDFASGWDKVAYPVPLNLILRGLRSAYIRMVRAKRHKVTMAAYQAGYNAGIRAEERCRARLEHNDHADALIWALGDIKQGLERELEERGRNG